MPKRNLSHLSKSDIIVESITESIRNGSIPAGYALPSVNAAIKKFKVARKTVVRAYDKLKVKGFIESRPKKGFFVISKQPNTKTRVLLIIHSFDGHFQTFYNEFRNQVSENFELEIYFHHYNISLLDLIVARNIDSYDMFIVSSFNHPRISGILGRIPASRVLIISRNDRIEDKYNEVVQDFFEGTKKALNSAIKSINKYNGITLSYPLKSGHPEKLKKGFEEFCSLNSLKGQVVDTLENIEIIKGHVYVVIDDEELIKLLKICKIRNWKPGADVGVISYNDTPLKEVIRDGITVISCNFDLMATEMANFLKNRETIRKVIPISLTLRNSL